MKEAQSYSTARAFRQALETRLQERAKHGELVLERLRKQVAFDRFLALREHIRGFTVQRLRGSRPAFARTQ